MNEHHDTHLSMHTIGQMSIMNFCKMSIMNFCKISFDFKVGLVRVGFGSVVSSMIG